MVWPEVYPHHKDPRQHHLPGPSRPSMAFSLSWKVSPPDLQKRPSSYHGGLPLHLYPPPQTPGTVSESASSLVGRSQNPREGAPDTRSTPLSLSSPVKARIVQYLTKRYSNKGCAEIEYLPRCPDDCSRGQHLRWCPAISRSLKYNFHIPSCVVPRKC